MILLRMVFSSLLNHMALQTLMPTSRPQICTQDHPEGLGADRSTMRSLYNTAKWNSLWRNRGKCWVWARFGLHLLGQNHGTACRRAVTDQDYSANRGFCAEPYARQKARLEENTTKPIRIHEPISDLQFVSRVFFMLSMKAVSGRLGQFGRQP